jgi:hypothetical protein
MIRTSFSRKENSDSGLALVLLLLLTGLWGKFNIAFKIDAVLVLLLMIQPALFFPFTFIWLNASDFLGKLMSKILLILIYILFVMPVALIRRISGKDTLRLSQFKKSDTSVFVERNHTYTREDSIHPY